MNTTLNQIRDESPCAVDGCDREIRLYAVWCARQVQHLMTDQRSIDALDVAERYANGLANENELAAASDAAEWDAAWAVGAASDAAGSAAGSAAASDAARAADAASDAASDAARAAQEKRLRKVCAEIDAAIEQPN